MHDKLILMKSLPLFLVRRFGFRVNSPANPSESRSAKYALYFILGGLLCQLLFFVPLYYFFEQNYNVFSELTFDVASPLIDHLTRERRWLRGFLVSALMGQALFFLVFGTRIFHRVFAPVDVLKRKINSLAKGYWRPWPLKLRRHDEFGEVVENLNYLSATLHAHAKKEMHILQRLRQKVNDPEFIFLIDQMLEIKSHQTGLPVASGPNEPADSVHDSDLAS